MKTSKPEPGALVRLGNAAADEVQHITRWWEDVVFSRIRGEAPRAICGAILEQDPDGRPTLETDPLCPRCLWGNP